MFPTNNPDQRPTNSCSRVCPVCNLSECLTLGHQDWDCRCGHNRRRHIAPHGYFTQAGYHHPHPCLVDDCGCIGLVFTTAEDMVADLAMVVEQTRPTPGDASS